MSNPPDSPLQGYPWGMLPPLLWVGEFDCDVDLGLTPDTVAIKVTPEIATMIQHGRIRPKDRDASVIDQQRVPDPSWNWTRARDLDADPRYPNLVPALTPEYYQQAEIDRRVFWQQPLPAALAALERMRPAAARWYLIGWEHTR